MDAPVYLLMAMHCHQPVGNFGFVVEEAYQRAYEPFLAALERHPNVRLALHYSGNLLDWLAEHHSRFLKRLNALAQRHQVELLASGYYEPILPMIPEADRQGQIALMQQALRQHVGTTAHGLWLTERVWEPELPQTLKHSGIRYTMLDANQFRGARDVLPSALQVEDAEGWDLLGCYTTDYAGASVVLFPASKRLRYWMPFQDVSRTIEFLRRLQTASPIAISFADDGEKFGFWPKTYQWVYEQGWLEQFFCALERESSWLATDTFSHYLDTVGANGTVYLPCGSYEEMLEWSGGYFRNFFIKYPEARAMYHKMLSVSQQLQTVQGSRFKVQGSKQSQSKSRKHSTFHIPHSTLIRRAQRELYMAQCNDAYWHGVFGGLYLAHLRRAVYRHLITADELLGRMHGQRSHQILHDLDGDGRPEVVLRSDTLGVVIDPHEGGTVTELDCYEQAVNVVDTLARQREPYHETLRRTQASSVASGGQAPPSIHEMLGAKEEGLEDYLVYDDHRRSCFLDYALSAMPSLQEVWRSSWGEHRLWAGGPWELMTDLRRPTSARHTTVTLGRRVQDGMVRKTVSLARQSPRLAFRYQLVDVVVPVVALEFNVGLRDARHLHPAWQESVKAFQVRDQSLGITVALTCDPAASLVSFPVETVSGSEEGLERTYQGLAMVFLWLTDQSRRWSCELEWAIGAC
jgi:alpha-amylase